MGNICCGPREDPKISTQTMKKALLNENNDLIPPEYFEKLKLTTFPSNHAPESIPEKMDFKTPKSAICLTQPPDNNNHNSKNHKDYEVDKKSEETKTEQIINIDDVSCEIQKMIETVKNENIILNCLLVHPPHKVLPPTKGSSYNESEVKKDDSKMTLYVVDEDLIKRQRSVIGHILKTFSKNLLQGKSLTSISFPVQVFEPRSVLQRIAGSFAYAPNYLKKASETKDPLEQIKLVLSFMVAGLHLNITQRKPFNPILGETYQGFLGDSPIFMEQVCHHPPISYFLVKF